MQAGLVRFSVFGTIGAVGSFIANLFGGWGSDLITLIIFMAIDFILGLILAAVFKKSTKTEEGALESNACWKGLCKKCVTLLIVLMAHRLDVVIGTSYVRTAVVVAFIVSEAVSIIENAGLMGIPMPNILKKTIEVLRKKGLDEEKE